jgi:plasmid stabilization system protein ParE
MKRVLHRSNYFGDDFDLQHQWYLKNAGESVAARYLAAVQATLRDLISQPGLGRSRRFRHPALLGLHSFRVQPPFHTHLIFYRHTESELFVERLMHGKRDLPRRLATPPDQSSA